MDYSKVLDHTERNIRHLLMQGKTAHSIAHILEIGYSTVSAHKRDMRNKLHAENDAQLVARYLGWRGFDDD